MTPAEMDEWTIHASLTPFTKAHRYLMILLQKQVANVSKAMQLDDDRLNDYCSRRTAAMTRINIESPTFRITKTPIDHLDPELLNDCQCIWDRGNTIDLKDQVDIEKASEFIERQENASLRHFYNLMTFNSIDKIFRHYPHCESLESFIRFGSLKDNQKEVMCYHEDASVPLMKTQCTLEAWSMLYEIKDFIETLQYDVPTTTVDRNKWKYSVTLLMNHECLLEYGCLTESHDINKARHVISTDPLVGLLSESTSSRSSDLKRCFPDYDNTDRNSDRLSQSLAQQWASMSWLLHQECLRLKKMVDSPADEYGCSMLIPALVGPSDPIVNQCPVDVLRTPFLRLAGSSSGTSRPHHNRFHATHADAIHGQLAWRHIAINAHIIFLSRLMLDGLEFRRDLKAPVDINQYVSCNEVDAMESWRSQLVLCHELGPIEHTSDGKQISGRDDAACDYPSNSQLSRIKQTLSCTLRVQYIRLIDSLIKDLTSIYSMSIESMLKSPCLKDVVMFECGRTDLQLSAGFQRGNTVGLNLWSLLPTTSHHRSSSRTLIQQDSSIDHVKHHNEQISHNREIDRNAYLRLCNSYRSEAIDKYCTANANNKGPTSGNNWFQRAKSQESRRYLPLSGFPPSFTTLIISVLQQVPDHDSPPDMTSFRCYKPSDRMMKSSGLDLVQTVLTILELFPNSVELEQKVLIAKPVKREVDDNAAFRLMDSPPIEPREMEPKEMESMEIEAVDDVVMSTEWSPTTVKSRFASVLLSYVVSYLSHFVKRATMVKNGDECSPCPSYSWTWLMPLSKKGRPLRDTKLCSSHSIDILKMLLFRETLFYKNALHIVLNIPRVHESTDSTATLLGLLLSYLIQLGDTKILGVSLSQEFVQKIEKPYDHESFALPPGSFSCGSLTAFSVMVCVLENAVDCIDILKRCDFFPPSRLISPMATQCICTSHLRDASKRLTNLCYPLLFHPVQLINQFWKLLHITSLRIFLAVGFPHYYRYTGIQSFIRKGRKLLQEDDKLVDVGSLLSSAVSHEDRFGMYVYGSDFRDAHHLARSPSRVVRSQNAVDSLAKGRIISFISEHLIPSAISLLNAPWLPESRSYVDQRFASQINLKSYETHQPPSIYTSPWTNHSASYFPAESSRKVARESMLVDKCCHVCGSTPLFPFPDKHTRHMPVLLPEPVGFKYQRYVSCLLSTIAEGLLSLCVLPLNPNACHGVLPTLVRQSLADTMARTLRFCLCKWKEWKAGLQVFLDSTAVEGMVITVTGASNAKLRRGDLSEVSIQPERRYPDFVNEPNLLMSVNYVAWLLDRILRLPIPLANPNLMLIKPVPPPSFESTLPMVQAAQIRRVVRSLLGCLPQHRHDDLNDSLLCLSSTLLLPFYTLPIDEYWLRFIYLPAFVLRSNAGSIELEDDANGVQSLTVEMPPNFLSSPPAYTLKDVDRQQDEHISSDNLSTDSLSDGGDSVFLFTNYDDETLSSPSQRVLGMMSLEDDYSVESLNDVSDESSSSSPLSQRRRRGRGRNRAAAATGKPQESNKVSIEYLISEVEDGAGVPAFEDLDLDEEIHPDEKDDLAKALIESAAEERTAFLSHMTTEFSIDSMESMDSDDDSNDINLDRIFQGFEDINVTDDYAMIGDQRATDSRRSDRRLDRDVILANGRVTNWNSTSTNETNLGPISGHISHLPLGGAVDDSDELEGVGYDADGLTLREYVGDYLLDPLAPRVLEPVDDPIRSSKVIDDEGSPIDLTPLGEVISFRSELQESSHHMNGRADFSIHVACDEKSQDDDDDHDHDDDDEDDYDDDPMPNKQSLCLKVPKLDAKSREARVLIADGVAICDNRLDSSAHGLEDDHSSSAFSFVNEEAATACGNSGRTLVSLEHKWDKTFWRMRRASSGVYHNHYPAVAIDQGWERLRFLSRVNLYVLFENWPDESISAKISQITPTNACDHMNQDEWITHRHSREVLDLMTEALGLKASMSVTTSLHEHLSFLLNEVINYYCSDLSRSFPNLFSTKKLSVCSNVYLQSTVKRIMECALMKHQWHHKDENTILHLLQMIVSRIEFYCSCLSGWRFTDFMERHPGLVRKTIHPPVHPLSLTSNLSAVMNTDSANLLCQETIMSLLTFLHIVLSSIPSIWRLSVLSQKVDGSHTLIRRLLDLRFHLMGTHFSNLHSVFLSVIEFIFVQNSIGSARAPPAVWKRGYDLYWPWASAATASWFMFPRPRFSESTISCSCRSHLGRTSSQFIAFLTSSICGGIDGVDGWSRPSKLSSINEYCPPSLIWVPCKSSVVRLIAESLCLPPPSALAILKYSPDERAGLKAVMKSLLVTGRELVVGLIQSAIQLSAELKSIKEEYLRGCAVSPAPVGLWHHSITHEPTIRLTKSLYKIQIAQFEYLVARLKRFLQNMLNIFSTVPFSYLFALDQNHYVEDIGEELFGTFLERAMPGKQHEMPIDESMKHEMPIDESMTHEMPIDESKKHSLSPPESHHRKKRYLSSVIPASGRISYDVDYVDFFYPNKSPFDALRAILHLIFGPISYQEPDVAPSSDLLESSFWLATDEFLRNLSSVVPDSVWGRRHITTTRMPRCSDLSDEEVPSDPEDDAEESDGANEIIHERPHHTGGRSAVPSARRSKSVFLDPVEGGWERDGIQSTLAGYSSPCSLGVGRDLLQCVLVASQVVVCSQLNSPGCLLSKHPVFLNDLSEGPKNKPVLRTLLPSDFLPMYSSSTRRSKDRELAINDFTTRAHYSAIALQVGTQGSSRDEQRSMTKLNAIEKEEGVHFNLRDHHSVCRFLENHKTLINVMLTSIRSEEFIIPYVLPLVTLCPMSLTFENKVRWFRHKMKELEKSQSGASSFIPIMVRRSTVFQDTFEKVRLLNPSQVRQKFKIRFEGEEGEDAGGVKREWYGLVTKECFNPLYGLFIREGAKSEFNAPNPESRTSNSRHIEYFRFVGRILGKCLTEHCFVDCYFQRFVYAQIVGRDVVASELESRDPVYYRNLMMMKNHPLEELGLDELTFTINVDEFGATVTKDLIPNGVNIIVTDENKAEYIEAICHYKMITSVRPQIEAILKGIYEVVPLKHLSLFSPAELELLVCGCPVVDCDDFESNLVLVGYTKDSPQIVSSCSCDLTQITDVAHGNHPIIQRERDGKVSSIFYGHK
eukprot:GHVH01006573.1.p1 GENE.GHVH01006573.1~~GHVH01006573.1.p1  ORF type:complete len:3558 (-),score=442.41 GHVH01006573.1:226-9624(-)